VTVRNENFFGTTQKLKKDAVKGARVFNVKTMGTTTDDD
jgi:hypothetical protein